MNYRYYCPAQPPEPGAVPPGAVRVEYADEDGYMMDEEGTSHAAWGFVEYDRRLTGAEIDRYELDPETGE